MSPLDRMLGILDLSGLRCTVSQRPGVAVINRDDGMQATARDAGEGFVEVIYEQALHDTARETCEPALAAAFLRAILSRKQLEPVRLPPA